MPQSPEIKYDVASVLSVGKRDYQEDALANDFTLGSDLGYAVLSDGMGGHAAGDIASKIVVTEVFSELKLQSGDPKAFGDKVRDILGNAVQAANECVQGHSESNPKSRGMGATLIATAFLREKMHWISVGDSPLYLFRNGELRQLNEDHSLAPQIDFMVRSGMMTPETGANHPDRNCLTSVLMGGEIEKIDCPADALTLRHGDILILASDGLQFLTDAQLEEILNGHSDASSTAIADQLLDRLQVLDDPDQDNVSITVIKFSAPGSDDAKGAAFEVAWDETADTGGTENARDWAADQANDGYGDHQDDDRPLLFRPRWLNRGRTA